MHVRSTCVGLQLLISATLHRHSGNEDPNSGAGVPALEIIPLYIYVEVCSYTSVLPSICLDVHTSKP